MRRLRGDGQGDEGMAMLMVIALSMVMGILAVSMIGMTVNTLRGSSRHVVFGQSGDAAEAGVDQTLARLQKDSTYVAPAGLTISDSAFSASSGWSSVTAERNWARTQINALRSTPSAVSHTAQGDFIAIRPSNLNTVYSMGFIPSVSNATRVRLEKADFLFSSYSPGKAILTNGDITCCPSYNVGLAPGSAASAAIPIHSNGNLGGVPTSNNGGTVVADASGSCSGCTSGTPQVSIPPIDPRTVYVRQSPQYAGSWYDLCPDASVRSAGATPCTGTVLSTALPYRGWSFSGGTWDVNDSGSSYPGVYYAYRANVHLGSPHLATISAPTTIITEATANRACPRTDGDVTMGNKSSWTGGPYIPGLMVLAGGNFYQNNNAGINAGSDGTVHGGAFIAQGSVNQHTSAHDNLTGMMLAEDFCGESNSLQGSVLYYDGGDDLPLQSTIRTSLELELP